MWHLLNTPRPNKEQRIQYVRKSDEINAIVKHMPVLKTLKRLGHSPLTELINCTLNKSLSFPKDEKYTASSLGFISNFCGLIATSYAKDDDFSNLNKNNNKVKLQTFFTVDIIMG